MDTSHNEPGVALPAKRNWRRHSDEFKLRVIALAREPNTSVAAVALANGLNANMLRRWVREAEATEGGSGAAADGAMLKLPAFVPVALSEGPACPSTIGQASVPAPLPPGNVAFEIRRGGTSVHASLPLDARSAAWLREVLG